MDTAVPSGVVRKGAPCVMAVALLHGCSPVVINLDPDGDSYELIDDMEHHGASLPVPPRNGRTGKWAVYNDGTPTAMQVPDPHGDFAMFPTIPPRGSSHLAARTFGEGFKDPGRPSMGWAQMVVELVAAQASDGGAPTYDASAYRGVRFWARIKDDTKNPVLRFSVNDLAHDPRGGLCSPDSLCYNNYFTTVPLTTDWARYKILFRDLAQGEWPSQTFPSIDIEHVIAIVFGFTGPDAFDIWIDDLEFIVGPYASP